VPLKRGQKSERKEGGRLWATNEEFLCSESYEKGGGKEGYLGETEPERKTAGKPLLQLEKKSSTLIALDTPRERKEERRSPREGKEKKTPASVISDIRQGKKVAYMTEPNRKKSV